jgi:hypothetical protein
MRALVNYCRKPDYRTSLNAAFRIKEKVEIAFRFPLSLTTTARLRVSKVLNGVASRLLTAEQVKPSTL